MKDIRSFRLDNFPLKLKIVTDLIYFDGPLLTLSENESGDSYLYYWCDADENYNRWMILRLGNADLTSYIFKRLSLKDLILSPVDGFVYIADIDDELRYNNVWLIQPDKLPEQYIPEGDSFYDFESESDEDSRLLLLNHIFHDKKLADSLLKLLYRSESVLNEVRSRLTDISPAGQSLHPV